MHNLVYLYGTFFLVLLTFLIYLFNDGLAQSLCFLIPFLDKNPEKKMVCFNYLLPSWDANQTWLVFCLALLYGGFPGIFSTLIPNLYTSIFILLVMFLLRGACIEFIFKEKNFYKYLEYTLSFVSIGLLIMESYILSNILIQLISLYLNITIGFWYAFVLFLCVLSQIIVLNFSRSFSYLYLTYVNTIKYGFFAITLFHLLVVLVFLNVVHNLYVQFFSTMLDSILMVFLIMIMFCAENHKVTNLIETINKIIICLYLVILICFFLPIMHKLSIYCSYDFTLSILFWASIIILPFLFMSLLIVKKIFRRCVFALYY